MIPERERRLATLILRVLRRDIGRTDADLARLLGCDYAEVRRVGGILYRSRRADRCHEYLVLRPRPAEGSDAA